ncbi:MAG: TetR/AcrR family transcriptional regulator [Mycobacterium sp.]|nr:TetR/AcrR family transcriptional regulator [Mycobacterium sp.]
MVAKRPPGGREIAGEDLYEVATEQFDVFCRVVDLRQRDAGHRGAPAIDEVGILGHPDAALPNAVEHTQLGGGFDRMTANIDGRARGPQLLGALHNGDGVAAEAQLTRTGQPGDARTRDENAHPQPPLIKATMSCFKLKLPADGLHRNAAGGNNQHPDDRRAATMADEPATRRPGGRNARVRNQILSATAELVARDGIAHFRYEDVAESAGVHKTSVYRNWPDREALVVESLIHYAEDLASIADTGHIEQDLADYLLALARALEQRRPSGLARPPPPLSALRVWPARGDERRVDTRAVGPVDSAFRRDDLGSVISRHAACGR